MTITSSRFGYAAATTHAGAICTLTVYLPSGSRYGKAPNDPITSNAIGQVSFSYPTDSSVGQGSQTVSCSYEGVSGSATATWAVNSPSSGGTPAPTPAGPE